MTTLRTIEPRRPDPAVWVDEHGDALFRYALLRLNDVSQAEDVVQETFLAALKAGERFAERSSERTWLIGILKHKVADHLRRQYRQGVEQPAETDTQSLDDWFTARGTWREGPARWKGRPDRALEDREFWAVFQRCMSGLPNRLRSAFALRELDGLSGEEITATLGVSASNLWVILHRARLQLRKCLEIRWFRPGKTGNPTC